MRPSSFNRGVSMWCFTGSITNSSRTCIASIRPSTSPLSFPNSTICINSHSIETGLSAIRGGFTRTLGNGL